MSKLVFEVFLSNKFLIFAFTYNHGHEFGFGIFESILKNFVLGKVRVLDVLPKGRALGSDVGAF